MQFSLIIKDGHGRLILIQFSHFAVVCDYNQLHCKLGLNRMKSDNEIENYVHQVYATMAVYLHYPKNK